VVSRTILQHGDGLAAGKGGAAEPGVRPQQLGDGAGVLHGDAERRENAVQRIPGARHDDVLLGTDGAGGFRDHREIDGHARRRWRR
jgi:hypothetical protein